jgi:hypothetical protein
MRKSLDFVRAAVEFGERSLGLLFDGSFKKYAPDFKTANWLYVSYPHALSSALPQAAAFLFDWNTRRIAAAERRWMGRGMHTYLYKAEAHGGSKCPITPALLGARPARQFYVILHEAWHSTLRLKGVRIPYPLEEATGRAVGVRGAVEFAKSRRDRALIEETENQARDWGALAAFINKHSRSLDRLYSSNAGRSEVGKEFGEIESSARALREKTASPWEKEELTRKMNNAFFLRYRDYTKYYPLALKVFDKCGSVKKAMRIYIEAGRRGAIEYITAGCK